MKKNQLYIICFFLGTLITHTQVDYSSFKGEKIKTEIPLRLEKVFFKEYGSDFLKKYEEIVLKNENLSSDTPENVLTLLYSVSSKERYKNLFISTPIKIKKVELEKRALSDSLPNKLRLIQRLTFTYKNKRRSFLKYLKFNSDGLYSPELLSLEKTGKGWVISENKEFQNIEFVIKKIKPKAFWEFFNRQNNSDFPEINKFKPYVQDTRGILDIEKLAKVIKENKAQLSKYLDN